MIGAARRAWLALALAAFAPAVACQQAPGAAGGPRVRPTRAAASAKAPARPAGPASPAASVGVAPSPAASALPAYAGPTVALTGAVAVDAAYVERALGARPAADGRLALAGGEAVLAATGAAGIERLGAALIGNHGGGLIANNGGGIITNNGGGVVSTGAGGLISDKAGAFRLAAEPAGDFTPAAGMIVQAVSLRTHQPVGKPVLTDATGAYRVDVPADERENALVVALMPDPAGRGVQADPRLQYATLARGASSVALGAAVDDDTASTVRYLRTGLVGKMEVILTSSEQDLFSNEDGSSGRNALNFLPDSPAMRAQLRPFLEAAAEARMRERPPAEVRAVAQRLVDLALASTDLAAVQAFDPALGAAAAGVDAVPAIEEALVRLRRRTGEILADPARGPAFFEKAPVAEVRGEAVAPYGDYTYVDRFDPDPAQRLTPRPYRFASASDLSRYILAFFDGSDRQKRTLTWKMTFVFHDLGLWPEGAEPPAGPFVRAVDAVGAAIGTTLIFDEAVRTEAIGLIRAPGGP